MVTALGVGFAATASEQALATVRTLGQQNNVVIEQDQMVGIDQPLN